LFYSKFFNKWFLHLISLFFVYNLASVILVPFFNYISEEFKVGDWYNGLLIGGFFFSSFLFGILWSYISDRYGINRLRFISVLYLISSSLTCLLFYIKEYTFFLLLWIINGGFMGGIIPISHSIISDLFHPEERARAFMFWLMFGGMGLVLGYIFALIANIIPSWRYTILSVSILSLIFAIPSLFTKSDIPRGLSDLHEDFISIHKKYPYRIKMEDLLLVIKRENFLILLQGILGSIPNGILFTWAIHLISRNGNASLVVTITFIGIASLGSLLGASTSYIADILHRIEPAYKLILVGISSIIEGILFLYFFLNIPNLDYVTDNFFDAIMVLIIKILVEKTLLIPFLILFIALYFNAAVAPVKNSTVADINLPEHRATILSTINLVEILSRAAGITIIGALSYYSHNLKIPVAISMSLWIPSGIAWIMLSRTFKKSHERVIYILKKRLSKD